MDVGSVLDALLERRAAYVSDLSDKNANHQRPRHSTRHGQKRLRHLQLPPRQIAQAVEHGVNPFMLPLQRYPCEEATRLKSRAKRAALLRGHALTCRGNVEPTGPSSGKHAKADPLASSSQSPLHHSSATTAASNVSASESPRVKIFVQQDRRDAVPSRVTAARHRDLRDRNMEERRGEQESLKRHASALEAADRKRVKDPRRELSTANAEVRSVKRRERQRQVWERRCTTAKIKRLHRGITKATGLHRYWYGSPSLWTQNQEPSVSHVCSEEVAELVNGCSTRRLRCARRTVAALGPQKPSALETGRKAAMEGLERPLTRRQRGELMKRVHAASIQQMWCLLSRVTSERRRALTLLHQQSDAPPLSPTVQSPSPALATTKSSAVLPLRLCRLFPLFGAVVEIQDISLRWVQRHCAPELHVHRCQVGIVLEEYATSLGVVLIPTDATHQKSSEAVLHALLGRSTSISITTEPSLPPPLVERVHKFFPGSSGSSTALISLLLSYVPSAKSQDSASLTAMYRIAVFRGELDDLLAVSCAPYALTRLVHRCL